MHAIKQMRKIEKEPDRGHGQRRRRGRAGHCSDDALDGHGVQRLAVILECGDVGERGAGDGRKRLFGEEGLMACDDDVGEGQQPCEHVVANHVGRQDASRAYEVLLNAGVLVRRQDTFPDLTGCIRVTVGTPEENDAFLRAAGV